MDFVTWWSDQHNSYWHCYSLTPTYGHPPWIVNGRIKEHNPEKLLLCSNTAGQQVIKLSTQCWRLPIQRPSKGGHLAKETVINRDLLPFTILSWEYWTTKLCNSISFILHHWWNSSNLNKMFNCCLINALSFGIFFPFMFFARAKKQYFFQYNHYTPSLIEVSLLVSESKEVLFKCNGILIRPPNYLDTCERNLLIITNLCHLLRQTLLRPLHHIFEYMWAPLY